MEADSITFPQWAMWVMGFIIVPWLVYLTIKAFENDRRIAINTENDKNVSGQITDLKTDLNKRIDKMEDHIEEKFDKVFDKIDKITRL